jgi:hypothetical protein
MNNVQFRPRSETLQAGAILPVSTKGAFFHLIAAANSIEVSVDDGEYITITQGQGFETEFKKLHIKSATTQAVSWVTGAGRFVDSADNVNVTTSATVAAGNTYTPKNDVTVLAGSTANLISATVGRLSITITNPTSNSNDFRLGVPLNVGAGKGDILEPGDSITLAYDGALDAYNSGATDEALIVGEVIA